MTSEDQAEVGVPVTSGRSSSSSRSSDRKCDERLDSLRTIPIDNNVVGNLMVHEPFWSDDPRSDGCCGTGSTVWDGSILLAQYLVSISSTSLSGARFLELGAGCSAIPSCTVSRLNCCSEIVATDGDTTNATAVDNDGDCTEEYNLRELRRNVNANTILSSRPLLSSAAAVSSSDIRSCTNGCTPVVVAALPWEMKQKQHIFGKFDCIVAAEVIYDAKSVPSFIETLRELSHPKTLILLYFRNRNPTATQAFWSGLSGKFRYEKVSWPAIREEEDRNASSTEQREGIFRLTRV